MAMVKSVLSESYPPPGRGRCRGLVKGTTEVTTPPDDLASCDGLDGLASCEGGKGPRRLFACAHISGFH